MRWLSCSSFDPYQKVCTSNLTPLRICAQFIVFQPVGNGMTVGWWLLVEHVMIQYHIYSLWTFSCWKRKTRVDLPLTSQYVSHLLVNRWPTRIIFLPLSKNCSFRTIIFCRYGQMRSSRTKIGDQTTSHFLFWDLSGGGQSLNYWEKSKNMSHLRRDTKGKSEILSLDYLSKGIQQTKKGQ